MIRGQKQADSSSDKTIESLIGQPEVDKQSAEYPKGDQECNIHIP